MRIEVDIDGNITEHEDAPIAERSEEEVEQERINLINAKCGEIIYSKYTREKQFNISQFYIPYTIQDKEEMDMFIETARQIAKDAKTNGTLYENINWGGLDL